MCFSQKKLTTKPTHWPRDLVRERVFHPYERPRSLCAGNNRRPRFISISSREKSFGILCST